MRYCRPNIAAMQGYVPGEQPRDRTYIKLNTNENPYPPSPAVAAAVANFATDRLRLYPDPLATELRESAGRAFGVSPGWILCGNGSDDLLTIAVRTYVDQGGALACLDPTYSLYPVLADIQGADTIRVPLDEDFRTPPDLAARAAGAALLFLARPNAPTGLCCTRGFVADLAAQFEGIVWVDEAYADFADDDCLDLVAEHPNLVVSRTVSKSYSLAGIRLGFAVAQPAQIAEMMKVKDSYNVGMLVQAVGKAALDDRETAMAQCRKVCETRERLCRRLAEMAFEVVPSSANFVFTRPPVDAARFQAELKANGILIRYFDGPRTGDCVRITVGTDAEIDQFLRTTAELLP